MCQPFSSAHPLAGLLTSSWNACSLSGQQVGARASMQGCGLLWSRPRLHSYNTVLLLFWCGAEMSALQVWKAFGCAPASVPALTLSVLSADAEAVQDPLRGLRHERLGISRFSKKSEKLQPERCRLSPIPMSPSEAVFIRLWCRSLSTPRTSNLEPPSPLPATVNPES